MNLFKKVVCVLAALSWGCFVYLDNSFQRVISQAVAERNGTYGELYGPLSFFRPVVLYLSLVLTAIALCLLFWNKRKLSKE